MLFFIRLLLGISFTVTRLDFFNWQWFPCASSVSAEEVNNMSKVLTPRLYTFSACSLHKYKLSFNWGQRLVILLKYVFTFTSVNNVSIKFVCGVGCLIFMYIQVKIMCRCVEMDNTVGAKSDCHKYACCSRSARKWRYYTGKTAGMRPSTSCTYLSTLLSFKGALWV